MDDDTIHTHKTKTPISNDVNQSMFFFLINVRKKRSFFCTD